MDAIILCGGKGTRLASVINDVPKPLAPVHGRPFLDYVLDYLLASGLITRFIFATGHLAEKVEQRYGDTYAGIPIAYSREMSPLGTGGALLHALRQCPCTQAQNQTPALKSEPVLLVNGDSFVDASLSEMLALHQARSAGITLALYRVEDAARFGTVLTEQHKVTAFAEKTGLAIPGMINSGMYLIDPSALNQWLSETAETEQQIPISLECEIIPQLIKQKQVFALACGSRFIDIGLPETYSASIEFFTA